jgi:hypothetical protein
MDLTWWKCKGCEAILPERADKCSECGAPRPSPTPEVSDERETNADVLRDTFWGGGLASAPASPPPRRSRCKKPVMGPPDCGLSGILYHRRCSPFRIHRPKLWSVDHVGDAHLRFRAGPTVAVFDDRRIAAMVCRLLNKYEAKLPAPKRTRKNSRKES